MDTNDLIKALINSQEQLNQILTECKVGPSELELLAYKMDPLLKEFTAIEEELLSPLITSTNSNEVQPEATTAPQE